MTYIGKGWLKNLRLFLEIIWNVLDKIKTHNTVKPKSSPIKVIWSQKAK